MGRLTGERIPVRSHALDIPERVRELDGALSVMLNRRTQKYEIWREEEGGDVLECVLPYDALDERTVRHVRRHRMERMEALLREVEEHNRKLEEETRRRWLEEAGERTREAVKYLRNRTDEDEVPAELVREGME